MLRNQKNVSEAGDIVSGQARTRAEGIPDSQAGTPSEPAVPRRMDLLRQRRSHSVARRLSTAGTVVLILVVVAAVLLLILGAYARGGKAFVGGYRPLIVLSGSMTPKMPVGGVVITKTVDPTAIKVGDIITFMGGVSNSADENSPFVTHRVVQILPSAGGLSFITKGDANNTADPEPVAASQVVGRVVLIVPWLGYLSNFVHGFWGWLLMIILPAAIIIAWEVRDLLRGIKKGTQAAKVLALTVCLFGATQMAFASPAPANSTGAYFSAHATAEMRLSTGTWENLPQNSLSPPATPKPSVTTASRPVSPSLPMTRAES